MQPMPEGRWGMPEAMQRELPGYDPDIAKSRAKPGRSWRRMLRPDKRTEAETLDRNLPTIAMLRSS